MIDADALKESANKNLQGRLYRFDVYGLICDAPTIDAIPVEFIKKTMDAYSAGSSYRTMMKVLMELWKDEQEGKDEPKV